jgi:hypothetical protein
MVHAAVLDASVENRFALRTCRRERIGPDGSRLHGPNAEPLRGGAAPSEHDGETKALPPLLFIRSPGRASVSLGRCVSEVGQLQISHAGRLFLHGLAAEGGRNEFGIDRFRTTNTNDPDRQLSMHERFD